AGLSDQQRVTVRRRIGDGGGADRTTCTRTIFDHDVLPERGGKLVRNDARDHVAGAARRIGDDQMDRLGGKGLGGGGKGGSRNCGRDDPAKHATLPDAISRAQRTASWLPSRS